MREIRVVDQTVDGNSEQSEQRCARDGIFVIGRNCHTHRTYRTREGREQRKCDADYTETNPEIEDEVVRVRGKSLTPGSRINVAWQIRIEELIVAIAPEWPVDNHIECRFPDR